MQILGDDLTWTAPEIAGLSQKPAKQYTYDETLTVEVCELVFESVYLHKCINIYVVNQGACIFGT